MEWEWDRDSHLMRSLRLVVASIANSALSLSFLAFMARALLRERLRTEPKESRSERNWAFLSADSFFLRLSHLRTVLV